MMRDRIISNEEREGTCSKFLKVEDGEQVFKAVEKKGTSGS